MKLYVQNLKLHEASTKFLMMPAKMNMKNNPKFAKEQWNCDACKRIDSQSHVLWCPFFAPLREGKDVKNDKDLVDYFQKVLKIREEIEENGYSRNYPGSDRAAEYAVLHLGLVPEQKIPSPVYFCLK